MSDKSVDDNMIVIVSSLVQSDILFIGAEILTKFLMLKSFNMHVLF